MSPAPTPEVSSSTTAGNMCTKLQKGSTCMADDIQKALLHMCSKSLPARRLVYMWSVFGLHLQQGIHCQAKSQEDCVLVGFQDYQLSRKAVLCRSVRLKP